MRKLLLFTSFFILCTTVKSQTYQDKAKYLAVYELTYQPDSTNIDSKKSEYMRLYLGNKYSLFASSGTIVRDSLMENRDRSNKSMAAFAKLQSQIPDTQFNYKIFKGIPDGNLTVAEKIVKDRYRYEEDISLFNWDIQSETKKLFGYDVQKATTYFRGREFTAWFTSEIPISDGPYKFRGLPGLILQITDSSNEYSFKLTQFSTLKSPKLIDFEKEKFRLVERDQYLKAKENFRRDPIGALEQHGITLEFERGQREKMHKEHLEKIKSENNPLELE